MQIGADQGQFMALLVQAIGAKRCLEIGTYTGYSALAVALALPEDGHITCCDVNAEWTAIAQRFWKKAGVGGKIELRLAPALDTLKTLKGPFDFVFIDADKPPYAEYFQAALRLSRPGTLIVAAIAVIADARLLHEHLGLAVGLAAHERVGDRVQFLGVDILDARASARGFLREIGWTYPSVFDPDGQMLAQAEFCPSQIGTIKFTVMWTIAELGVKDMAALQKMDWARLNEAGNKVVAAINPPPGPTDGPIPPRGSAPRVGFGPTVDGRIITMRGDEVIEPGTVVVTANRIISVGASAETPVPDDAFGCCGKRGDHFPDGPLPVAAAQDVEPDLVGPEDALGRKQRPALPHGIELQAHMPRQDRAEVEARDRSLPDCGHHVSSGRNAPGGIRPASP